MCPVVERLKNSSNEKILGVHVDHNFVWNNHFQYVSKKMSSYLWLLSQIRSYLTEQHRLLYYNAYIKPHLEHCCIVWGNSSNFNTYKIEKLQRRACKLILGKDYNYRTDFLMTIFHMFVYYVVYCVYSHDCMYICFKGLGEDWLSQPCYPL